MPNPESWTILTADLCVGTSLSFDLQDSQGRVILKAGVPVSDRLKALLAERGIESVVVRGAEEKQISALLLESYDGELVKRLQKCICETESLIEEIVDSLKSEQKTNLTELTTTLDGFLIEAQKDISATLGVIGSQASSLSHETIHLLSSRATHFSFMSLIVGLGMGLNREELTDLGVGTILHDISLAQHPEWFSPQYRQKHAQAFWDEYQYHGDQSAEWLTRVDGITNEAISCVMQVHELLDGAGFPRGILGSQMSIAPRIAGLVDAYCQMVHPFFGASTYDPSDALAYLCKQSAVGKFDSNAMRSLLRVTSVYPIGSKVMLNDGSLAVVVRASESSIMRPVVKRIKPTIELIDMTQSNFSIVGPYEDKNANSTRITKSMLDKVLWEHPPSPSHRSTT